MNQNSYIPGHSPPQQAPGAPLSTVNLQPGQTQSSLHPSGYQTIPNAQAHNLWLNQPPNSPPTTPQPVNSEQHGSPPGGAPSTNTNVSQHPQLHPRSHSEPNIAVNPHFLRQGYVQTGPTSSQQSQVQFQRPYQQSIATIPEGSIVQQDQVAWVPIPGTNPQQYQQYQQVDTSELSKIQSAPGPSGRIEPHHSQLLNPMPWIKKSLNGKYFKKMGKVAAVAGNEMVVIGTIGMANPMKDWANFSNARTNEKKWKDQLTTRQNAHPQTTMQQNTQEQQQQQLHHMAPPKQNTAYQQGQRPMMPPNQQIPYQQGQPHMSPPNQHAGFQQHTYGRPQQVPTQPGPVAQTSMVHGQYTQQPSQQLQAQYQQPIIGHQAPSNIPGGQTHPGLSQPNQQPQVQNQYIQPQNSPAAQVHTQSGQLIPSTQQGMPQVLAMPQQANQSLAPGQSFDRPIAQGVPRSNIQAAVPPRKAVGSPERIPLGARTFSAPEMQQNATLYPMQAPGNALNSQFRSPSDEPPELANPQGNSLNGAMALQQSAIQQQFHQGRSGPVQDPQMAQQQRPQMQNLAPMNPQGADIRGMSRPGIPQMQQGQSDPVQRMVHTANKIQAVAAGAQVLGVVGNLGIQGDRLVESHQDNQDSQDQQQQDGSTSLADNMASLSIGGDSNNSSASSNQLYGSGQDSYSNYNDQSRYASYQDPTTQYVDTSQSQGSGFMQGTGDSTVYGSTDCSTNATISYGSSQLPGADLSDPNAAAGYPSQYTSADMSPLYYADPNALQSYGSIPASPNTSYVDPNQATQYSDESSQYGYYGVPDQSQAGYDDTAQFSSQNDASAVSTLQEDSQIQTAEADWAPIDDCTSMSAI